MKIINLLNAKEALTRLLECKYTSFKVVRELANLRKVAEAEIEFYIEQEKKIVTAYSLKDEKGNPVFLDGGRVQLKDEDSKTAFEKEITDLRSLEVETITPVSVRESDFRNKDDIPSPNDLFALEGIVDFVE
jgi:hypothetical protein